MRVILFQPRFAALVRSGAKTQTMRKKAGCKVGYTLSLRKWSGQPRKSKHVLIKDVVCKSVVPVYVDAVQVMIDGRHVDQEEFARKDGFGYFGEMVHWIATTHGLPFHGELISW